MFLFERMKSKGRIKEADQKNLPKGVLCRGEWPTCNIDILNQNNRMYERAVWDRVMKDDGLREKMENRTFYGQAEHPEKTASDLPLTSHVVTGMFYETAEDGTEVLFSNVDILKTPAGQIINTLIEAECQVGVSTRAEGDLEEAEDKDGNKFSRVVAEAYDYRALDFTADPSTFGTCPMNVQQNLMSEVKEGVKCKNKDDRLPRTYAKTLLESLTIDEAKQTLTEIMEAKECAENGNCICSGCGNCDKKKDPDKKKTNEAVEGIDCPKCHTSYQSEIVDPNGIKDCPSCLEQAKQDEAKEITIEKKKAMSLAQLINSEYIKMGLGAQVREGKDGEDKPGKIVAITEKSITIELEDGTRIETETATFSADALNVILPQVEPNFGLEPEDDELHDDELPPDEPTEEDEPVDDFSMEDDEKNKNPFEGKVFENFTNMVDFMIDHVKKLPKKEAARLGKMIKANALNESSASEVIKEMRKLKVSEASANAERDAAFTLLDEVDAKLEGIYSQHSREVKILSNKLTEAKVTDTDITALVAGMEKRTAALKETREKLVKSKTVLATKEKEIQEKVEVITKELNEAHAKNLVETYVGMKLSHSGLTVQESSRALLEKCVSTKEVDEVFDSIKDAMRADALRPDKGEIKEIKLTPTQQKDKKVNTQKAVTESVHTAMDAM